MIYDLQKASVLKRASAFLLDAILVVVLATGIAVALSAVLRFGDYSQTMLDSQNRYEVQCGVDFDLTEEEFNALPQEQQQAINDAWALVAKDPQFRQSYDMVVNLSLVILSLAPLFAILILDFILPLVFGNGQTVGKKVFGIAVMKTSGVKINTVSLFIRTLLGKYTIETMIPLLLIWMIFWNIIGIVGPIVIVGLLILQVGLMIASPFNAAIHDSLSQTVAVDLASQMIFADEAAMIAYKQQRHEEMVRKQTY